MIQVDWILFNINDKNIPLNKKVLIKWNEKEITVETFTSSHSNLYLVGFNIEVSKFIVPILAWSTLEEKQKELVTYSFSLSEKEVQQLNNLLDLASDRLDSMSFRNHEYLESNLKKFQDLFSKVEF